MQVLKQSTQIKVRIGPFVDATDGVTPEVGVTLGAADQAELLKADGAATVDISGATWAAVTGADGWYDLTLTTSHTDTVGTLAVVVQDSSVCLPVFARFQVVEEAVYDALFAASAAGYQVPIWSSAGATVNLSATTIKTATDVETDTADIQSRLPAALNGGKMDSVVPDTQKVDVNTIKTQAVTCAAGVTVGVYVGGTGAAALETTAQSILTDTAEIGVAGAGLTEAGGTGDQFTAIPDMATASSQATIAGYIDTEIGTIITHLTDIKGATWSALTDSLEAIRDRGDAAWITATGFSTHSAADVWAVGTRTITGGTITTYTGNTPQTGDAYAVVNSGTYGNSALKTIIDTLDDYVDTEVAAIKAKTDQLTFTVPNQVDSNALTVVGTADDAVLAAIAALSIPTAVQIRTEIDSNSTQLAAIVADTNELQSDWTNTGRLDTILDTIASNVVLVLADTGTDGVVLSAAQMNKIADHVRRRTQANVEASSDGDAVSLGSLYGFIQQAQESSVSGGTLTVKKTDGSTTLGTKTIASSAAADPVTGIS